MLLLLSCPLTPSQKDYDLTNYDDWDLLDECCDDAAASKIVDADCTNMPPRPTENTNGGGSDGPSEAEDGVVQVRVRRATRGRSVHSRHNNFQSCRV
jgi:hypothetical protein